MSQRCKNKNIENIEKTTHKQLTNNLVQSCLILILIKMLEDGNARIARMMVIISR